MNLRLLSSLRNLAAPVSSGVESFRLWKMAFSTVAGPFSAGVETSKADLCDGASAYSAEKAKVVSSPWQKRKIFEKMRFLTVETIDLIMAAEEKKGIYVTQADLFRWAKRLKKEYKHENALEIFRWMDKEKMLFSAKELELYVDLMGKVEDFYAALQLFEKVDPNFRCSDPDAKNWPAYLKLLE